MTNPPDKTPDFDMLAKFQPEDICEPASFLENCMFVGVGLLALAVWLLVGWIIWG